MSAPTLEVFVPGPVRNPLNGSYQHWAKHRRWARGWRERTEQHLLVAAMQAARAHALPFHHIPAEVPKRITFEAHTLRTFDDDNLRAALKPLRDALVTMRVIDSDAPAAGHQFVYVQRIVPRDRGVVIRIELLQESERHADAQNPDA